MSDSSHTDDFFERFEEYIEALGGVRRFEIQESQDEPSIDKADKAENEVLDLQRPKSLEELIGLLNDCNRQDQADEARKKRVMVAIYIV